MAEEFTSHTENLSFALTTGPPGHLHLEGYSVASPIEYEYEDRKAFNFYPSWKSSFAATESVVLGVRGPPQTPASHGKVLGDRSTLYKYANPHVLAVVTTSQEEDPEDVKCTVHLVDSAKGTILYSSALHSSRKGVCDLKVTFVENWLVYHYWDDGTGAVNSAPGWRVASVELYEGDVNVKRKR